MHESDAPRIEPREVDAHWFGEQIRQWLLTNGMPPEKMAMLQRPFSSSIDFAWLIQPDSTVKGGETLAAGSSHLEVIWTPGHSPGHICLHDVQRKILFSGDHVLPIITSNVTLNPHTMSLDNPLGCYLDSLRTVQGLEADLVLPAHQHIFQNLAQRVQELFQHHEQRIAELMTSLADGEKTAYQIALKMPWMGLDGVTIGEELSVPEQAAAMGETLAHLELLRREGKVQRLARGGITLFHTPSTENPGGNG
jgi:glyoxylase-like metal-dependent hydrolase (beta-lactamase superfamily II)